MIVAYTTAPNESIAREIAHHLIKANLASCINLIPKVKSIYYWQDEIVEDSEVILMIKKR